MLMNFCKLVQVPTVGTPLGMKLLRSDLFAGKRVVISFCVANSETVAMKQWHVNSAVGQCYARCLVGHCIQM